MNEEFDIPTFETIRGRSCINLTICNKTLAQKTAGWSCGEEESCSNHKLISFGIELGEGRGNATQRPGKRYHINADKWGTFNTKLEQCLTAEFDCQVIENNSITKDNAISQKVKQCTDIGIVVKKFISAITEACDATFKVSKPSKTR